MTEADVDWAYGVLSKVREAMDKATGNDELSRQLMKELAGSMVDIMEAMVILVEDEHRGVVSGIVMAWVRWAKSCQVR